MTTKLTGCDVGQVMRIDVLPDDVLLGIFDFYVDVGPWDENKPIQTWQSLVHVCRRWRSLVLESPRRLNLHLLCTPKTPINDTLDVWPALPLIVMGKMSLSGTDNVIAALGPSNRVRRVSSGALRVGSWKKSWPRWRWRSWSICGSYHTMSLEHCQSLPFPIRSWVDLPHVYNPSCLEFHFRDFQNRYCLLITSSILTFLISLIPIHFTGSDGRSHLRVV